jgi:hypothetical protein
MLHRQEDGRTVSLTRSIFLKEASLKNDPAQVQVNTRPIPGRQAIAMDERDEQGGSWHPFRSLEFWADDKKGKKKITRSNIHRGQYGVVPLMHVFVGSCTLCTPSWRLTRLYPRRLACSVYRPIQWVARPRSISLMSGSRQSQRSAHTKVNYCNIRHPFNLMFSPRNPCHAFLPGAPVFADEVICCFRFAIAHISQVNRDILFILLLLARPSARRMHGVTHAMSILVPICF